MQIDFSPEERKRISKTISDQRRYHRQFIRLKLQRALGANP